MLKEQKQKEGEKQDSTLKKYSKKNEELIKMGVTQKKALRVAPLQALELLRGATEEC